MSTSGLSSQKDNCHPRAGGDPGLMSLQNQIPKENFHHSYLIEGDTELIVPELNLFFEMIGLSVVGNPDISHDIYETFTIDNARAFRKRQLESGVAEGKKIFVVSVGEFTIEAQQALLKMFEEPAPNTNFFIIMRTAGNLLPTLRSRFQIIAHGSKSESDAKDGKKFLNMSKKDRLEFIAKMIKKHKDDDESSQALKKTAIDLIDGIESTLYKDLSSESSSEVSAKFRRIASAREYIPLRGSSVKMILEDLALVL
jgi:DNA polymerase III delta prime subunit